MASNYGAMRVTYQTTLGVQTSVGPGVSVKIRAEGSGSDEAESPLTTDSNGEIPAGSLASVVAGTVVHFRAENFNGLAFNISQTTT